VPDEDEPPGLDDVLAEFKAGLSRVLSPEDVEAHLEMAIAYAEMGLIEEAIAEVQVATDAGSTKARGLLLEILFRRARALDRANELSDALLAYQRVLNLDPTHARAREALARLSRHLLLA
jgi:tetratricopeptide (TPR) repeat protein